MTKDIFHVALCMGGSVSAGAYTAGVMDYLMEALENWEKAKDSKDPGIPDHRVIIDLLCGTSGGGITSAISLFAMQDKINHSGLNADCKTYSPGEDNILWKTWVTLTKEDFFPELLKTDDVKDSYVPSALNVGFVNNLTDQFSVYIKKLAGKDFVKPPFLCTEPELFVTLFNVTGINYLMKTNSDNVGQQYVTDHRDIGHFSWSSVYKNDGCIELLSGDKLNVANVDSMLSAAKATSAFPVGLKARYISRKAKYIWDNPFFNQQDSTGKGGFDHDSIILGKNKEGKEINTRESEYVSINADGGVANTKPVEIAQDVMLQIRNKIYQEHFDDVTDINNTTVILIDPFPTIDEEISAPEDKADNLIKYLPSLVMAMRSQLLFDGKDALEAYRKDNYGLHVIAPSRPDVAKQQYAIACGSLGGFGGFLNYDFRVHDYFLGRHNCQSFLRKYFVVNLNEKPGTENYNFISSVIEAYKNNPAARARFEFVGDDNRKWAPIIPDVTLTEPLDIKNEKNPLPEFDLGKLPADYLEKYRSEVKDRLVKVLDNFIAGSWLETHAIDIAVWFEKNKMTEKLVEYIAQDLKKRGLMD